MDGSCPMLGAPRLRRTLIIEGYEQRCHVEVCVTLLDYGRSAAPSDSQASRVQCFLSPRQYLLWSYF